MNTLYYGINYLDNFLVVQYMERRTCVEYNVNWTPPQQKRKQT